GNQPARGDQRRDARAEAPSGHDDGPVATLRRRLRGSAAGHGDLQTRRRRPGDGTQRVAGSRVGHALREAALTIETTIATTIETLSRSFNELRADDKTVTHTSRLSLPRSARRAGDACMTEDASNRG